MDATGMRRRLNRFAAAVGLLAIMLSAVPRSQAIAASTNGAAAHDAGVWDLDFEKGNRRCRLFLRTDTRGGGFAMAMPPACHHAFPNLAAVTGWSPGENEHVRFHDDTGEVVLDFGPSGLPALTAVANENDIYTLLPTSLPLQAAIREAGAAPAKAPGAVVAAPAAGEGVVVDRSTGKGKGPAARVTAPTAALPPVTAEEVAGNYAVLRDDRDTGCMVTLEAGIRMSRGGGQRARLAPACRDQGIVIFDPAAWELRKGELVLMAKRGHTAALTRRDEHSWANAPTHGAALVLKRL